MARIGRYLLAISFLIAGNLHAQSTAPFASAAGSKGDSQINNGNGNLAATTAPGVPNTLNGAANNGSTDDATANITTINSLASTGGTALLGNNTLWTPPTSGWTSPGVYENILLQGKMTVKTHPWDLTGLQALGCGLPILQSSNANFTFGAGCDVVPLTAGTPNPVMSLDLISGGDGPNSISNIRVQGFSGTGLKSCAIDLHLVNFFSIAGTTAGTPFESCPNNTQFGFYSDDGGFETIAGSTNPSLLFHTTGIGVMNRTFLEGNGILDETTLYPSPGPNCGLRFYNSMLYENVPAGGVANGAFHTYDLTGCTFVGETYINPNMSDSADAITPMIDLKRSSGTNNIKDTVIINGAPTGAWFRTPADRTNYQAGATLLGGTTFNVLGLGLSNAYWNLLNSRGAIFSQGINGPTGIGVGSTGVGLAGPYQLVCTPSNSGGSLAAGTYWVIAAYEDTEASPLEGQISDEAGPLTTTGSSGSISCTWNQGVAPTAAIAATRLFIGTAQGQEVQRFRSTTPSGPFVFTTATGTGGGPTQMFPNPGNTALTTKWGNGGDYTGTENCTAIGKQGCTGGDTTPGDLQVTQNETVKNLTVTGICTGCASGTGTTTIFHGTAVLGTSAITSGMCATTVTVSATGVLTSDTVSWTPPNGIQTITGWKPTDGAPLSIIATAIADNIKVDVCNYTSGSLTPGSAVTLNLGVYR